MPYLIAEIAQAHDGSLGILHSYIDALANTGVNAVKFQTHIAEAESSSFEPFRTKFSYVDDTRYDYWKRMEFSIEQWQGIKDHCEKCGLDFISSPFSLAAVELLESIGTWQYKVGSGEVSNMLLLHRLAQTGKPVMLSSGMSDWKELDAAVQFLKDKCKKLSVLQCTTAYPTVPGQWGLGRIAEIKERYQLPVGFSDHSGTIAAGLAATALGAEILEFHAVFDKRMFGPDAKASLTIDEIAQLASLSKMIANDMEAPSLKEDAGQFTDLKIMFGKSLAVNKPLPAGHLLQIEDLESKKPADKGIPAAEFEKVIGQRTAHDLLQWQFLNWSDIAS